MSLVKDGVDVHVWERIMLAASAIAAVRVVLAGCWTRTASSSTGRHRRQHSYHARKKHTPYGSWCAIQAHHASVHCMCAACIISFLASYHPLMPRDNMILACAGPQITSCAVVFSGMFLSGTQRGNGFALRSSRQWPGSPQNASAFEVEGATPLGASRGSRGGTLSLRASIE